ncbi:MAG: YggS family pyridoxal phosphate-dependent enzyme [Myxococcota bacterium]
MNTIAERLATIRRAVEAAAAASPHGQAVTLIGVSKRHGPNAIAQGLAAGLIDFGENYAQELAEKVDAFVDPPRPRWHFIGPLQSNKAKLVAGAHLIHTVDRPKVLGKLEALGVAQDVLVQVNVAAEPQKAGVTPEGLEDLLARFADLDHVRCRGLMLIPPRGTPEQSRPHFAALRALRDRFAGTSRPGVDLKELSMGMSADFAVAIEEGATLVRVGTAIFGPRPAAAPSVAG